MIYDILSDINQKNIILASESPRRYQILNQIGLEFEIAKSFASESGDRTNPVRYVEENAYEKANKIEAKISADLIIAADTIVFFRKKILEKPKNKDEIIEFLNAVSNETHEVITGVYLKMRRNIHIFSEITKVSFHELPESLILAYAESTEAYDKAGAYGIQGIGASFVKKIEGCYFNVMGFPISQFCLYLRTAYVDGFI